MKENDILNFSQIEEECRHIIKDNVTKFLSDKSFNVSDSEFMINYLTGNILKEIKKISDNFKFIVSIVLMHNDECGFTQNIGMIYDTETDGTIVERYTFRNIVCITNLFCLSL